MSHTYPTIPPLRFSPSPPGSRPLPHQQKRVVGKLPYRTLSQAHQTWPPHHGMAGGGHTGIH